MPRTPMTKNTGLSVGSIDELLEKTLTPKRLASARKRADAILQRMTLDELRRDRKVTQNALAEAMQTSQDEVSRISKRGGVRLGTIRNYVQALGGHVEVRAVFPDKNVELAIAE